MIFDCRQYKIERMKSGHVVQDITDITKSSGQIYIRKYTLNDMFVSYIYSMI